MQDAPLLLFPPSSPSLDNTASTTKMTSRAASAANSRRAKQEIVRLLFGSKYKRKGPEAHRKLDPFQYSYNDLRTAYLEKLHAIHPDKSAHIIISTSDKHSRTTRSEKDDLHQQFVELQEAWDQYETVIRMLKNVKGGEKEEANFTLFGVGCSFSDSPEEQRKRAEITDQACRGWFPGGQIAEVSTMTTKDESELRSSTISLVDDDWFISTEEKEEHDGRKVPQKAQAAPRRSLVQPHFRPRI